MAVRCQFLTVDKLKLPDCASIISCQKMQKIEPENLKNPKEEKVSYIELYRYATGEFRSFLFLAWDIFLIFAGTLCAVANGCVSFSCFISKGLPLMTLVFGDIMNAFLTYDGTDAGRSNVESQTRIGVLYFTVIGIGIFIASYGQLCFWMIAGENQAKVINRIELTKAYS